MVLLMIGSPDGRSVAGAGCIGGASRSARPVAKRGEVRFGTRSRGQAAAKHGSAIGRATRDLRLARTLLGRPPGGSMATSLRLVIAPGLAHRLAPIWVEDSRCAACRADRLRTAVGRAAHGARRIGAIRIGVLALRLPIYRVELLGRPVELITRPTFGNAARVLAIVPA
ncbi:MAG: hypothetical protein E6J90_28070, partial [Deltaproteobacteria bacterium]